MTPEEVVQAIMLKHPEITQEQIKENLAEEKNRAGGLLGDETLLRLIAAKYGVEITQNTVFNVNLSSGRLFAGLNDVTVAGRLIAIYPTRSFQGEKSGKFANLMIIDNDGVLRVVLWNEKAELIEKGELKAGQIVRLVHGYTREDRYGKVELHLGIKSNIEVDSEAKNSEYPSLEKFATKISDLTNTYRNVHLVGRVKEVFASSMFTRGDMSDGTVLRFTLGDGSGVVNVVAWNEKAHELEKTLKPNLYLELVNAKVKETQGGLLEIHLDFGSFVNFQPVSLALTRISDLKDGSNVNVEGEVCLVNDLKEVTTAKGETVKLLVFELKDDTGVVRVSVWRNQAEDLCGLKIGDQVTFQDAYAKKGYGNGHKMELAIRSFTAITVKKL